MGIQEDIKKLKEVLIPDENGEMKKKKFRFPFGKKVGRSQKKKNYATILVIQENGIYDFKKYQIVNQTVLHEMIPRLATVGCVLFNKKGNPLIILPSWSVEPFSPKKHFYESLENGSNVKGFAILMDRMKTQQIAQKKKIGNALKWIIGALIAGVIIYAILTGGAT